MQLHQICSAAPLVVPATLVQARIRSEPFCRVVQMGADGCVNVSLDDTAME